MYDKYLRSYKLSLQPKGQYRTTGRAIQDDVEFGVYVISESKRWH
jgi:hypothetical protein